MAITVGSSADIAIFLSSPLWIKIGTPSLLIFIGAVLSHHVSYDYGVTERKISNPMLLPGTVYKIQL